MYPQNYLPVASTEVLFLSHEDVEKAGRVRRVAVSLDSTEFLLYMHFLDFILGPLNAFNTSFQSEESKVVTAR